MLITVFFYGVLAEVAGTRVKTYQGVSSFGDLSLRIMDDFPEIVHYNYRYCHNKVVMVDGEAVLADGDEVALLPPFYGG
ncbi:MAG: MoaD/ThiS family protein [Chloroflexota bacterium]